MKSGGLFRVSSLLRQCRLHLVWNCVLFLIWASDSLCTVANGQGTVYFRNKIDGQVGAVDAPFFNENGVRLEGSSFVAQLYGWKAGEGYLAVGTPVPFATNGYFFGGIVVVPFAQGCLPAWVQVRAWAVHGGATFEEASTARGWTGVSGVLFLSQTGDPGRPETGCEGRLTGLEYPGSPLVVQQPQDQTVLVGTTAVLSVIASSGVQVAYQWYQDGGDRPDGLIVGATNATYTTPPLSTNTTFWVTVSNSAGSVLSDKATVTVVPSTPRLSLERVAGLPVLILDGLPGITYRIESSTNLSTPSWSRLVDLSLSTSPFTFSDAGCSNCPARYYRAVAP